jgi:predicted enzyme related to lactoylglutathione lyase
MSRVIHFEIQATGPDVLIQFYEKLFGWSFVRWEGPMPYWLIKTGEAGEPGIDGGLLPRNGGRAAPGQGVNCYVCTVDVVNLDAALTKTAEVGGTVVVPKMPIPGVGWLAYANDPDGNIFGMMESDPATA